MRRLTYILLAFAAALTLASCTAEIEGGRLVLENMRFKAVTEQYGDMPGTKTILAGSFSDNVRQIEWEPGDKIAVASGSTFSEFINTESKQSSVAVFDGTINSSSSYSAAFPYGVVSEMTKDLVKVNLPDTQSYVEDNFASTAFPMVAKLSDGEFQFKNLCGILVLRLTGEKTLKKVTFTGFDSNGKALGVAGEGQVSMDYESVPELVMSTNAKTSLTLDCGAGVQLDESTPKFFYLILPAATYSSFTLVMECADGTIYYKAGVKPLTIERSKRVATASFTYAPFIDLSDGETANSYIVSQPGCYKFPAVQGNSSSSVGAVASAEVLWESFGTDQAPSVGDLVRGVSVSDGYINFQATSLKGNALIAAKDASGNILWSWHIWMTDMPQNQVYKNGAGTLMDRNLGASSATPGDVKSLGLMYQWGRKDPFMGADGISSNTQASSSGIWPKPMNSNSNTGTISYAQANPMTFILYNDHNYDWHYTGDGSTENARWSDEKTMYDPCPAGYRVPTGAKQGVWAVAIGHTSNFEDDSLYDDKAKGIDFKDLFGTSETCWYPAGGFLQYGNGRLSDVSTLGYYWSCTPPTTSGYCSFHAFRFRFSNKGEVSSCGTLDRADGRPVRCFKEGSAVDATSSVDLSADGTANSYIVSEPGQYKIKTVKGNTLESVGDVASAEVLWESFGTDETPRVGDLIGGALYKDGYIAFSASNKKGNALIAAKDASGTILWSWHIWMTDMPVDQVYNNYAGAMMDRNLGATSATPGDVHALGLMYQWGRKDPFMGGCQIAYPSKENQIKASSTNTWPASVQSDESYGTIEYSLSHPMTIITRNESNHDWQYSNDNTRWQTTDKSKGLYDPCPSGYRVPEGGETGVWSKAFGTSKFWDTLSNWDSVRRGMDYCSTDLKLANDATIWYPAAGSIKGDALDSVGADGYYWSCNPAYGLFFCDFGRTDQSNSTYSAHGRAVRCFKEGSAIDLSTAVDLSADGTANAYIVSSAGTYKFKTVKGNTNDSVGTVASVVSLWESFGTSTKPSVGDLVCDVSYVDGFIAFTAFDKKGNAVIAAKDASGTILWSWHIWMTDAPVNQVYNNGAGTMMDRNLGATSATPGDVHALGLLYQWGRKDPFLGGCQISYSSAIYQTKAASTGTWPEAVSSDASNGTITYAVSHPTTFITGNISNYDWYYTGSSSTDNTRWQKSGSSKGVYDPCPPGYRVPDGGSSGVWSKAFGTFSYWTTSSNWDSNYKGINFGATDKKLGSASTIWYPSTGELGTSGGSLYSVGDFGSCWSCSPDGPAANYMYFHNNGNVNPTGYCNRAYGRSVRCLKDGTSAQVVNVSGVSLNKTSLSLTEGQSSTLTATVAPSNATFKNVIWSSSARDVATVDQTGNVTAVKAGAATVTVTTEHGAKTATCSVTVIPAQSTDLSSSGTANSYIVSSDGNYKFKTVKGNGTESVGTVASAEVLWESYGTGTAPSVGDLVSGAVYADGYISFAASNKKGNAVIAAKDASGTILWSWHIWLTDAPVDQVYNNGAGSLMDRNLGATSATPGDVQALGLMYQWGRKDPFMGGCQSGFSAAYSQKMAASTGIWPSDVSSDASNGTIAFAVSHPMSFIKSNSFNSDWYYTGSGNTDNTRWQTSDKSKGLYDPCPVGYRVPDGGSFGVWARAFETSTMWTTSSNWDSTNHGMNFGNTDRKLGVSSIIWYPSCGFSYDSAASIYEYGYQGNYWSCMPSGYAEYCFCFTKDGGVAPAETGSRVSGQPVRCFKEGSSSNVVNVTGVSLDKTSLLLTEGQTKTLIATISPSNATFKSVRWSSSDNNVVTVDQSGKVTAVKAGYAVLNIRTEDGAKTAKCSVTVISESATNLSSSGTSNSYIVSSAGSYKFKTVRGNSATTVGTVASTEVLWESYGTSTAPPLRSHLSGVAYVDGYIYFTASDNKGNAVIAAKDADGNILWSWHIWMTDKPVDQVYNNGAGTLMDRNLGATSAKPGDVQALGLLYQWGRKDPFLGSSNISSNTLAASNGNWYSTVPSNTSYGTIEYAIFNPTTFIKYNSGNKDWYYTGSSSTDDTRWQTSDKSKGLYDPCPVGYRVPDGGASGVWSKALGTSGNWTQSSNWDSAKKGVNFGTSDKTLGAASTIWYPSCGYLYYTSGALNQVGFYGTYWSCTPSNNSAYYMYLDSSGYISPSDYNSRAYGRSIRCFKEGSSLSAPVVTTGSAKEIAATSVKVSANVTSSATVTARGFVWSTSENPTLTNASSVTAGSGAGDFSASITGLQPNTTYYVCAYATNDAGTTYGNQITVKTKSSGDTEGIGNGDFKW